jgi:predicted DNA-binding transcriptional regulator YafY
MSKALSYERYVWFISQLNENRYPNATDLANFHEISHSQAFRDIEFIRDRLNAPIQYDSAKKGYYLTDESYMLPSVWIDYKELFLLTFSKELLKDKDAKKILDSLYNRIAPFSKLGLKQIHDIVSYKGIRFYKIKDGILTSVFFAILNKRMIEIKYIHILNESECLRVISPIHLIFYMGNWYLLAFSEDKIKTYALSRIRKVNILRKRREKRINNKKIKQMINNVFGIYLPGTDQPIFDIKLKFSKNISNLIKTVFFHEKQKMEELENGEILINFKSSINEELIREVLRFTGDIDVISPPELKQKIIERVSNSVFVKKD